MSSGDRPYALAPGEGHAIWYRGTLMVVKAASEQTGGAITVIEHSFPAAFAAPLHLHHRDVEPWYVLEGMVSFTCGDLTFEATPGAFVYLPRDVPHSFRVGATQPAKMLLLSIPAGLEGMFQELGEVAKAPILPPPPGPPDPERMRSVASKYGVEILGPPPGR
jgi:mannose-6-phosphate isomerase-like protein (cupin superfamily)